MKKFLFFFLILIIIVVFHICASASSIQDPALWPAIDDITKTGDVYTFKVNVRAYCPEGLSGNLLVAAYDENERLLDVVLYNETVSIPSFINAPLDNCDMTTFLEKTDLAQGIELKLKEKDNVIIKAFVMNFDTLTPEIPSGEITFDYNGANSCVNVDYTLKSDYKNEQIDANCYYYYYYYYDGKYDSVDISFDEKCEFDSYNTFYFTYYNKTDFNTQAGEYFNDDLAGKTITCTEIPGIKIANHINLPYTDYLNRYGFKTNSIKVYCDYSELE